MPASSRSMAGGIDPHGPAPTADAEVADIVDASGIDPEKARLFPIDQTETSRPGEAAHPRPATSHMDRSPTDGADDEHR